ncbi:MAG TPA: hypothetical protein VIG51_10730 [Candidatus Baltobacteraceae bacterium]|jgi:hypothetical protein
MTKQNWETQMYPERSGAEDAVGRLNAIGYGNNDISVMMNDKTREKHFAHDTGTKSAEGAVIGGVIGGGLTAIAAGLLTTGAVVATVGTGGLAAPLVAGPLAAVLTGLGAGGLGGGIIGALIGAGIPEERAHEYEAGLNRGGILIGVNPRPGEEGAVRNALDSRTTTGETASDTGRASGFESTQPVRNVPPR